jgi:integrase
MTLNANGAASDCNGPAPGHRKTQEVPMSTRKSTGHTKTVDRAKGPVIYVKWRCGVTGRQTQEALGPLHRGRGRPEEGHFTARTAEAELQRRLDLCDLGECDHGEAPVARTFGSACREWLRYGGQEKGWALTNQRNNRSSVNARMIPFFGEDTPIGEITTVRIDEFRVHLLVEKGLARETVRNDLAHVSGVFKRAQRLGWVKTNPYLDAEKIKTVSSGDFNVLSVVEVEAVARAAQDPALIRVAAYTGLRQGELRALRWRDVDFATSNVHVRRNLPAHGEEKMPKGKRVRSVPLLDQAATELERLSRRGYLTRPDDRVFVSQAGGPLDHSDIRDGFYEALEAAGLRHLRMREEPITFHDLRHTFATIAVQIWPLSDVQAYLGHSNIATTMRYVHHVPKTDAAQRGSAFIAAQMCPEMFPEPTVSGHSEANSAQLSAAQ